MLSTTRSYFRCLQIAAWFVSSCACILSLVSTSAALAQQYPVKPVRLINPFPTGGGMDLVARPIASHLSQAIGQQFVVENRPGATGTIGSEVVAKSPPDGYTLLLVSSSHATNPSIYGKLPFNTERDFASVSLLATGFYILVVHPSLPVHSVRELIAFAKRNRGQLNFSSSGNGTMTHLAGELFNMMAGVHMSHIPFKGSATSTIAAISGEVPILFAPNSVVAPFLQAGKLRALGVTSTKRLAAAPDAPTIAEAGLPGFEVAGWYGLVAPAGTPKEIISLLSAQTAKVMQAPELVKYLSSQSYTPVGSTPEAFASVIHEDIAKWEKVIRISGAKTN